jgi:hypothetical protein
MRDDEKPNTLGEVCRFLNPLNGDLYRYQYTQSTFGASVNSLGEALHPLVA